MKGLGPVLVLLQLLEKSLLAMLKEKLVVTRNSWVLGELPFQRSYEF